MQWPDILSAVDNVVAGSSKSFEPATIANAKKLIEAAQSTVRRPDNIGEGYWPSLRIIWAEPFEIEIFADHYELYAFHQGTTDITDYSIDETEQWNENTKIRSNFSALLDWLNANLPA